jgi:hypothetical protein
MKLKKTNHSGIRSHLNRLFTIAKKKAQTPDEYRALDKQERDASKRLLDEMIYGEDDGEWIRRV